MDNTEAFAGGFASALMIGVPVGAQMLTGMMTGDWMPDYGRLLSWIGTVLVVCGAYLTWSTNKRMEADKAVSS